MTVTTTTEHFNVYPYLDSHHKTKAETYVFIRIAGRKNVSKTIDIPIYYSSGVRLKINPNAFKKGAILKGYYNEKQTNDINDLISEVWRKVKSIVTKDPLITKQLIETQLYGNEFLSKYKKSRAKELHIPVFETEKTTKYFELRKKYPKRKEQIEYSYLDDQEFEVKGVKEIIIDPLDLSDKNYPHNFPPDLYNQYASEYKGKQDPFYINEYVLFRASMDLYNSKTKEVITVDNDTIKDFKTENKIKGDLRMFAVKFKPVDGESVVDSGHKDKLIQFKKQKALDKLSPSERYDQNHFDKNNLLHVFGTAIIHYSTKDFHKNLKAAALKIFDYYHRSENVTIDATQFNVHWVKEFILFVKENGITKASSKGFNPFDDNSDKFKGKEIIFYNDISLEKHIKSTKELIRGLIKKGLLPSIDVDSISYSEFNLKKVTQNTRKHFSLYNSEFDQLFNADLTGDESKARDLFILQTWLGGLRLSEFNGDNIKILKDDKNQYYVNYFTSDKNKIEVSNPVEGYSFDILKKYDFDFPERLTDEDYRLNLSSIAKKLFNRNITHTEEVDGKVIRNVINIRDEFSTLWARKTFIQILLENNIPKEKIKTFTGHNSDILDHYSYTDVNAKRMILKKIKIRKG